MKLRPNIAAKTRININAELDAVDLPQAVANFRAALTELEAVFVSRTEEIQALMLAMACGQHVLFIGRHGVAKSDIARETFRRVTGAQVYDKIFTPSTSPDDVFGPVIIESLKQGVWEHNTKGSFATSHFANLEELGRASEVLLPSMMTVLNERLFHNGNRVEKCPLISAVATTNFLTVSESLAAFNDRWLIVRTVSELKTLRQQETMLMRSLGEREDPRSFVSLKEVLAIRRAVLSSRVSEETVPLYCSLVSHYKKSAKLDYVSDRRLVAALRLARARSVLNFDGSIPEPITTEADLEAVRYALGDSGLLDESTFAQSMQQIIGQSTAMRKEQEETNRLLKVAKLFQDQYDDGMSAEAKSELRRKVVEVYDAYNNSNRSYTTQACIDRSQQAVGILSSIVSTIDEDLDRKSNN